VKSLNSRRDLDWRTKVELYKEILREQVFGSGDDDWDCAEAGKATEDAARVVRSATSGGRRANDRM